MTPPTPLGPNGTLSPEQFAAFLNDQALRHYPDPLHSIHDAWFDYAPYTFTLPPRTRERVSIPPGALVGTNPRLLRRMK